MNKQFFLIIFFNILFFIPILEAQRDRYPWRHDSDGSHEHWRISHVHRKRRHQRPLYGSKTTHHHAVGQAIERESYTPPRGIDTPPLR